MSKDVVIEVAGESIRLESDDSDFISQIEVIHDGFVTGGRADVTVRVRLVDSLNIEGPPRDISVSGNDITAALDDFTGHVDLGTGKGRVDVVLSKYTLGSLVDFVRGIWTILFMRHGGLVLHACGLATGKKACIFCGPSQSGKSTVAELSDGYTLLNDDMIAVKRFNGSYKAFATPGIESRRRGAVGMKDRFEIEGLFKLVQDKDTYLERLSPSEGIAEFLVSPNIKGLRTPDEFLVLYSDFMERTPCYRMHFRRDASFWKALQQEGFMKG